MKRSSVFIGLTALLFLFALFTPVLFAQPDKRPAEREGWLNLTPEQKTQFQEFRKARQEERKAFAEQIRKLRTELRELMKDPSANEKKIDGLIDELSGLRATQMKSGIRKSLDMKKIFTPEQLDKLKEARARMERRGMMRQGRGMMPRPLMRRGFRPGRHHGLGWGPGLGLGLDFGIPMQRWRRW
jgi:Spy/CpxP family protein refolding chaperone